MFHFRNYYQQRESLMRLCWIMVVSFILNLFPKQTPKDKLLFCDMAFILREVEFFFLPCFVKGDVMLEYIQENLSSYPSI